MIITIILFQLHYISEGDEERAIATEEITRLIILDEGTRGVGEEEV